MSKGKVLKGDTLSSCVFSIVDANVHDNFGIFILHCLFLIIIYEESRLKKWDISGLKRKNIVFFVFFLLKVLQF